MKIHFFWIFTLVFLGCSSKAVREPDEAPVEVSPNYFKLKWSMKANGLVPDLEMANRSGDVLVATIADPERSSTTGTSLNLYASSGKLKWVLPLQSPVKHQAISENGELAVYSDYREKLIFVGPSGQILAQASASCRPMILSKSKKVLCHHDDETVPDIGAQLFDYRAKKLAVVKNPKDFLSIKPSEDEKNIVALATDSQILLFDSNLKKIWAKSFEENFVDAMVSNGDQPWVGVTVFGGSSSVSELWIFDHYGNHKAIVTLPSRGDQVEFSTNGDWVYVYSNSPKGQGVFGVELTPGVRNARKPVHLELSWKRHDPRFADYVVMPKRVGDFLWVGFERLRRKERESHVLAFQQDGKLFSDLKLNAIEGAYLFSASENCLITATDNGVLSYYCLDRDKQ